MRIFFFTLLTLLAVVAVAQIDITVLDRAAIRDELVEPSVAVNPKDPEQIVIGATPDKVFYTDNGGESWSSSVIKSSIGVAGNPVVLADRKGKFYYLHKSENGLIVTQISRDGGATWSEQGVLSSNIEKQHLYPGVTTNSKGHLMTAWTQVSENEGESSSDIYLAFSSNGGGKWGNTIKLNRRTGKCCSTDSTTMGAVPVVYEDNRYFVVWAYADEIYLDRSLDGGKFWLKNEGSVLQQPGGWKFEIPGLNSANGLPSFMVFYDPRGYYNGRLLLLWSDQQNGTDDTDIWFAYSDNRGDSFQPPIRINNDEKGSHQFLPALTIDQSTGMIYILYYDRRNSTGLETEVYLAYSADGGLNFKNTKLSEAPFDLPQEGVSLGDYIGISASKGRIAAAWTAYSEGKTEIRVAVFDHDALEK